MRILKTKNESYGFYGTMRDDADKAWKIASLVIMEKTNATPEGIRNFLDSKDGRHFADQVNEGVFFKKTLKQAIEAAANQSMKWKISKRTSREHGIPAGLPYLTGWVLFHEINDELFA